MTMLLLDYQSSRRPLPRFGVGVLALALAVLGAIGGRYVELVEQAGALEAKAHELDRTTPDRSPAAGARGERAAKAIAQEVSQANRVLREISVPWDALFQAVEESGGKDVTLLSMEPDVEKRVARIVGEAKNMPAVLNYMRQLGKQPMLRDVYLQHHQIQQQDSEKPVRFALVAGWAGRS